MAPGTPVEETPLLEGDTWVPEMCVESGEVDWWEEVMESLIFVVVGDGWNFVS